MLKTLNEAQPVSHVEVEGKLCCKIYGALKKRQKNSLGTTPNVAKKGAILKRETFSENASALRDLKKYPSRAGGGGEGEQPNLFDLASFASFSKAKLRTNALNMSVFHSLESCIYYFSPRLLTRV